MPTKCAVPEAEAIAVIVQFGDHFRTNDLPKWSSDIWMQMSAALNSLNFQWTPDCVYTNVRNNRREILVKARLQMGVTVPAPNDANNNVLLCDELELTYTDSQSDNSSTHSHTQDELGQYQIDIFDLVLTEQEWIDIKPVDAKLDDKFVCDTQKPKLKPGIWTNTIAGAFLLQFRMPCAFSFKRADVSLSSPQGSYHIKIRGRCKSIPCGNIFDGNAEKLINEKGLIVKVKTRDTRFNEHEIMKRDLSGPRRKQVGRQLIIEGTSRWRKRQARERMRPGETEPPDLPSNDVLRQTKKEALDAQYGVKKDDGRDIIGTLTTMSQEPEYVGLIQNVGSLPFHVFYSTPAQMHAFKEYCRTNKKTSSLKLDATGSLVLPINRGYKRKSAHIFLYAIVINFEKSTICVHQMLSEQQNAAFVEYWLRLFLRQGAPRPTEAVCDYSRTLLSALCMAFNNQTPKLYISTRFRAIQTGDYKTDRPATFIRVDVAHLIHLVTRWECFQRVVQEVKEFYTFCIGLLVDCTTLSDFNEVFSLTCVVALQKYSDSAIELKGQRTPKEARKRLEDMIADRNIIAKVHTATLQDSRTEDKTKTQKEKKKKMQTQPQPDDLLETEEVSDETFSRIGSSIDVWIEDLVEGAKKTSCVGTDLSAFYLPNLVKPFSKLSKEFPFWSSVGFDENDFHSTTSQMEGYFNDLKSRVFNGVLPLRSDKFVKRHIEDINGATPLFASKIIASLNMQRAQVQTEPKNTAHVNTSRNNVDIDARIETTDPKIADNISFNQSSIVEDRGKYDDSDLMSVENWRGKGSEAPYIRHEDPFTEENETLNVGQLIENVLSPVLEEVNDGDSDNQVTGPRRSDHSYCKPMELDVVSNMDITENASYGKFILHVTEHKTSTPNTEEKKNNEKKTAITRPDDDRPTTQKKSKYFNSYPEIRQRNQLLGLSKKPSLLLNGLICASVKLNGKSYFVKNTCAFDAIVHVLMTAGIDNVEYAEYLQRSTNPTLQLIYSVIEVGIKPKTFVDRARILTEFSTIKTCIQTEKRIISYDMDATINIENILKHALASVPSVINEEACSQCRGRTYTSVAIAPNHWVIARQGFGALEKALGFYSSIYNIQCQNSCTGNVTLMRKPSTHIFIELDIRPNVRNTKGLRCKLDHVPATLKLGQGEGNEHYRLVGVVGFTPGHYTAYCLRSSGNWQWFDDMNASNKPIVTCKSNADIEPHLAVYVRTRNDN